MDFFLFFCKGAKTGIPLREGRVASLSWSGGFMPCQHLRSSSGREESRITYSVC